jgi:hypothetical protein
MAPLENRGASLSVMGYIKAWQAGLNIAHLSNLALGPNSNRPRWRNRNRNLMHTKAQEGQRLDRSV